jgi:hypothetical protein
MGDEVQEHCMIAGVEIVAIMLGRRRQSNLDLGDVPQFVYNQVLRSPQAGSFEPFDAHRNVVNAFY